MSLLEDAKCKGMAYELFEYQEASSSLAAGMNFKERLEFNQANHGLASEICIECPVFFECGEDATDSDRRWTVRMGEKPYMLVKDEKAWAINGEHAGRTGPRPKGVCDKGHVKDKRGRCAECRNQKRREDRAHARAERAKIEEPASRRAEPVAS